MKKFASIFEEDDIDEYGLAGITWYHHKALMGKAKTKEAYIWYAEKTIQNGWSHNTLKMQLDYDLYSRQVETPKLQNFNGVLPSEQSELALQTMKDPYIFDFVGEQYELNVGERDFYIDLLFYNFKLHCFVAVDLKTGEFTPEMAGKMNFYLSALDNEVKSELDNPSVGLILCKNENRLVAEYALKDMTKPIGVSEYKLFDDLPNELQEALPTAEDIEARIIKKYECE